MDERQADSTAGRFLWLGDALVVSIVTGLSYCVAYAADLGAASFFGVPIEMVSVTSPQVVGLAVFMLAYFGLPIALFIHEQPRDVPSFLSRRKTRATALTVCALIVLASLAYLIHFYTPRNIVVVASIIALQVALSFVARALGRRRIHQPDASNTRDHPEPSLSAVVAFYVINFAFAVVCLACVFGFTIAQHTTHYRMIVDGRFKGYLIVWRLSDELFVAQKYDKNRHVLAEDVALVKVEKDTPAVWRFIDTGSLDDVYSVWHLGRDDVTKLP